MRNTLLSLTAGALLLGATGAAEAAPKTPPAPPAAKNAKQAAAPAVDPRARAVLTEMSAAYKGLTSFSATMTFAGTGMEGMPDQKSTIAFKRPNLAAVATTAGKGVSRGVSDGRNFYNVLPEEKEQYLKIPAPEGAQAIGSALSQAEATGLGILPLLIAGIDPLSPVEERLKSLALGTPGKVGGVEVDTVVATLVTPQNDPHTFTFAVGKKDRLLRRMTMRRTLNGKTIEITETYGDVKANADLPAETFAFTPPPGMTPVTPPQPGDPKGKEGAAP